MWSAAPKRSETLAALLTGVRACIDLLQWQRTFSLIRKSTPVYRRSNPLVSLSLEEEILFDTLSMGLSDRN